MPDEEEAVAVAEEPSPEVVPNKPAEAVPPPGQEQAEEAASGVQEVEDEATDQVSTEEAIAEARQGVVAELKKLGEDDPGLVKDAFGEEQTVDEERLTWNAEKVQQGRMARYQQASTAAGQYVPQTAQTQNQPTQTDRQLYQFLQSQSELVQESAGQLNEGKITDPNDVSLDVDKMYQAIQPLMRQAASAASGAITTAQAATFYTALERSATFRSMNAVERQAFARAEASNSFAQAALVIEAAARRTAPESLALEATKKAQEDAGVLEHYRELKSKVGTGNNVAGTAPSKGKEPKTLEEIDEALRTGPTDKIDGLLNKRAALVE